MCKIDAAVTPPTANFSALSKNCRRLISPCAYPLNRFKSSCGKSDAFFRSMGLPQLIGGNVRLLRDCLSAGTVLSLLKNTFRRPLYLRKVSCGPGFCTGAASCPQRERFEGLCQTNFLGFPGIWTRAL